MYKKATGSAGRRIRLTHGTITFYRELAVVDENENFISFNNPFFQFKKKVVTVTLKTSFNALAKQL